MYHYHKDAVHLIASFTVLYIVAHSVAQVSITITDMSIAHVLSSLWWRDDSITLGGRHGELAMTDKFAI